MAGQRQIERDTQLLSSTIGWPGTTTAKDNGQHGLQNFEMLWKECLHCLLVWQSGRVREAPLNQERRAAPWCNGQHSGLWIQRSEFKSRWDLCFVTPLKASVETCSRSLHWTIETEISKQRLKLERTTKRTKHVHVTLQVSFEQDSIGFGVLCSP